MKMELPRWVVPRRPADWDVQGDLASWHWETVPALSPFIRADGQAPAQQQTTARVCYDPHALYVRFDCVDRNIWGTCTHRDDPLYDEEVVEVFLAPGEADPIHYFEFEVSPDGVLLDARIENPTSQRADLKVDLTWDCPGLRWVAERNDAAQHWWVGLVIPWMAVTPAGERPAIWRANFYRIERPRDAEPEFSCWSPTLTEPADFHKPARFGFLVFPEFESLPGEAPA